MAASICAFADVEDKNPATEAATLSPCESHCAFSACKAFLVDMGQGQSVYEPMKGCGNSRLWIIDPLCAERRLEINLLLGHGTSIEIAPGASGYAMLLRRLPWGDLQTSYLGYIYPGHRYRLWFCPDSEGTFEIWYKVGGQESNRIRINVLGGLWS